MLSPRCSPYNGALYALHIQILNIALLYISGGRRFSEGTSADREIQRTLMEVGILVLFHWLTYCMAPSSHSFCSIIRAK